MTNRFRRLPGTLIVTALLACPGYSETAEFRRIEIDLNFRSEGVALADVNQDGRTDVVVGDYWYQNPDWAAHEIRAPRKPNRGGYTEAFAVYADDFNGDDWVDVLVIPFHGKDAKWYENPQNKSGHWVERVAFKGTGNETRLYLDLFGDGRKVFLMGVEGHIAWVAVPDDPTGPWTVHKLDKGGHAAGKYYHGLGTGDINGDGRADVITPGGWWEQPEAGRAHEDVWPFHKADLGPECADMYAADFDGDGRNDVISTSAHRRGIWWHRQTGDAGNPTFERHTLDESIKETHALALVDINGDGKRDLVTGWRFFAHGFRPDRADMPSELAWFEITPQDDGPPTLVKHTVDLRSGVGAQFETADYNGDGLMDIIVSNRKGVFIFEQVK